MPRGLPSDKPSPLPERGPPVMRTPAPRAMGDAIPAAPYPVGPPVRLPTPTDAPADLWEVFGARRTRRVFSPLSIAALSSLLWYAGRTLERDPRDAAHERATWEHRVPPSAGGLHPIDLLIVPPTPLREDIVPPTQWQDATGLVPSSTVPWLYDGRRHAVRPVLAPGAAAGGARLRDAAARATPDAVGVEQATLVWLIAHRARTAARYTHPESLVWRDAGCVLMVLTLVASALTLACCPLGPTGDPTVAELLAAPPADVHGAGGVLFGAARPAGGVLIADRATAQE